MTALDIFEPANERERDFLTRARPRGVRPEIPAAIPSSNVFGSPSQYGSIPLPLMSTQTVLGLPAANRAKHLISNAVAQMSPLDMWTPDGYVADTRPSILARPNSVYQAFDFMQMSVEQAIMHGNCLALLADFDTSGYPQQLAPVPFGFWFAYIDGAGYWVYNIGGELYSRDEVFHVRANAAPNQVMGIGVVAQFRRALGQALDEQNFAADTYRSGAVPAGVITDLVHTDIDPAQADAVTELWLTNHAGGRAPAFLPKTMKFEPLSWSPRDLQFLQSQQFTVAEMAYMFNMDPTDLGASLAGQSMTYANIEQREQARITDTYAEWMRRFEEEFSDCLPGGNSAKFDPDRLLRTDSKTLAEVEQVEIANETLTPAEARKRRGRRPLPKPPAAPAVPGVPGAPAVTDANGLASDKPTPVPDDPNITETPVKVKA